MVSKKQYAQGETPAPHLNELGWIIYVFNELIVDFFLSGIPIFGFYTAP